MASTIPAATETTESQSQVETTAPAVQATPRAPDTATTPVAAAAPAAALTTATARSASDTPRPRGPGSEWRQRLEAVGLEPSEFAPGADEQTSSGQVRDAEVLKHVFLAKLYVESGATTAALDQYKSALQADPENPTLLLGIADAQAHARDFDTALATLDELLKRDANNIEALLKKARYIVAQATGADVHDDDSPSGPANSAPRKKAFESAIEVLQQAHKIQPKNVGVVRQIAEYSMSLGNPVKIVQAYRDWIALDPRNERAMLVLGTVLADTGRATEAVRIFEKVIEQRRSLVIAYIYLGQVYEKRLGQLEKAIETYERALLIDPRNDRIREFYNDALTRLYGERGKSGIEDHYAKFAAKYPYSAGIQRLFADKLVADREFSKAIQQFRRLIEIEPDNAEALGALGTLLAQNREFADARKFLEHAVDIAPDMVSAWEQLAQTAIAQADRARAIEIYRKALRLNRTKSSGRDSLLGGLANLLSQNGDAKGAVATLEEVTPELKTKPEFTAVMGQAFERARDFPKALDFYTQAFDKKPGDSAFLSKLIALNLRVGKPEAAAAALEKALTSGSAPKDDLYLVAGEAYQSEGDFAKATEVFEKAREENHDSVRILIRLVTILNLQKQHDRSISILTPLQTAQPPAGDAAVELLAQTYLDKKDYDKGLALYRKMQEARPSSLDSVRTLIDAYLTAKQPDNALSVLRQAEEKFGAQAQELRMLRGVVLYRAKRLGEAERLFRDLLRTDATSEQADDYHYYLGSIYLDQKKFDVAEKEFQTAIRLDPTNDASLNALGYLLADRNVRLDEARSLIEKALELSPGAAHILDSMGWINYRQGKFPEALDSVQRSLRVMGDEPEVLEHLGDIYAAMGEKDKARDAYNRALELEPTRPGVKLKATKPGAAAAAPATSAAVTRSPDQETTPALRARVPAGRSKNPVHSRVRP